MADHEQPVARRGGPVDLRLLRLIPALRIAMAVTAGATVVATLCTIVQAVVLARIVAAIFIHRDGASAITTDLIWLAAALAVRAGAAGGIEWTGQTTSARIRMDLRSRLLGAVARLGPRWLADTDPGAVATTAGPGIDALDGYATRALPAAVAAVVAPPLVLVAIGVTDWLSLLILIVALPLVPIFLALIGITTRRHMERQWATLSALAGQFLDLLEGLTTLKVYGRSRAQVDAIRAGTDRYRRHTLATLRVAFLSGLVLDLLATLSVAVVAVTIGVRLDHGGVSLERALVVLLLAPEVFAPLRAVGTQHHATEEARVIIDATFAVLDQDTAAGTARRTVADTARPAAACAAPVPASEPDAAIRLGHLGVTYPGRDLPALHDVTLHLRQEQLVALTGLSGAGKSTLLAVLLGQVVATSGSVTRAGGADPVTGDPDTTVPAWRADLAWMPQRPRPTQETVAEEVRLGDPELPDLALTSVLEECAAPPGSTPLGEDGGAISAGQRRRVALARVLVRTRRVQAAGRTPVVILDEPTEDLDDASAAIVRRVMVDMAHFAVVVAATHDTSLVGLADREVRLVDGRVTADATRATGDRAATLSTVTWCAAGVGAEPVLPTPPLLPPASTSTGRVLRIRSALVAAGGARRSLVLAGIFGILGGMSGLALTATSVWLICRAAQHPNIQALAIAVVGVRTFALARALLRYAERLSAHDGALRLLAEVRSRVFTALIPLAPTGLSDFRRGDLLRRFTSDVDGAQEALIRAVVPLAGVAGTGAATIVLAALIDPTAGWFLAAGLLAAGVAVPAVTARVAAVSDGGAVAGRRDALVGGLLDGLGELEAYGAVDDHLDRIAGADAASMHDGLTAGRAGAAGVTATGVVTGLTVTAMVAVGARAVAAGSTSGILLGVLAVTGLVAFDAAGSLPSAYAALGRCRTSMRRIDAVLTTPVPFPDPDDPGSLRCHPTGVSVAHITLRPAPGAPAVLVGASLDLCSGQRVALVGPSGSGKSTLLAAVLRLAPTEAGLISLHDAPGPDVPLPDLRADQIPPLVSGSLQGDHVFSTTLRDNLRFVAPDATDADLDVVATRVGLAGWVRDLPDGWSTRTGIDGAKLSGGQRQRLLVARGLLANPAILVLDEPTAHLDAETEAAVLANLMDATAGRTMLVSTHRSHLLGAFDQVLALEAARLEDPSCGRPEALSR